MKPIIFPTVIQPKRKTVSANPKQSSIITPNKQSEFSYIKNPALDSSVAEGSKLSNNKNPALDSSVAEGSKLSNNKNPALDSTVVEQSKFSAVNIEGIDIMRPEILMMLDHQDVYSNGSRTVFADIIDTHVAARRLNRDVMKSIIEALRKNEEISKELNSLNDEFLFELMTASKAIDNVYSFLIKFRAMKSVLSFRSVAANTLILFGFSKNQVATFSDTKIFCQLCHEIYAGVRSHTPALLGVSDGLLEDRNSVKLFFEKRTNLTDILLKKKKNAPLSVSQTSPAAPTSLNFINPALSQVLSSPAAPASLNFINPALSQVLSNNSSVLSAYGNTSLEAFTNNQHLKLRILISTLARELSISAALSIPEAQTALTKFQQVNDAILSIIGNVPADVTSPPPFTVNRLSLSPFVVNNERLIMLTETRWLTPESNETHTVPGHAFIIEPVLLDTPNKQETLTRTGLLASRIKIIADAERALSLLIGDPPPYTTTSSTRPIMTERDLLIMFVNTLANEHIESIRSILTIAVFSAAANNATLRDLLFKIMSPDFNEKEQRVKNQVVSSEDSFGSFADEFSMNQEKESLLDSVADIVMGAGNGDGLITQSSTLTLVTRDVFKEMLSSTNDNSFLHALFGSYTSLLELSITKNVFDTTSAQSRWRGITEKDIFFYVFESFVSLTSIIFGAKIEKKMHGISLSFSEVMSHNINKLANDVVENITPSTPSSTGLAKSDITMYKSVVSSLINDRDSLEIERIAITQAIKKFKNYVDRLSLQVNNFNKTLGNGGKYDAAREYYHDVKPSIIFTTQQALLIRKSLTDAFSTFNVNSGESPQSFFRTIAPSRRVHNALHAILQSDVLTKAASSGRKKIIAVGLPLGFIDRLVERGTTDKINQETAFIDKQADIIRLQVWRQNLEYENIEFRPIEFIFNASRFVPQNEQLDNESSNASPDIFSNSALEAVVETIKTKDLSAVATYEEEFLTPVQVTQLQKNHVIDFLLKQYIHLLTGLNVNEIDLPVSSLLENIDDHSIDQNVQALVDAALKNVGIDDQESIFAKLFSSSIAAGAQTVKKIAEPKIFDRVFVVPVDTADFVLVPQEELVTEAGIQQFNTLLSSDLIYEDKNDQTGGGAPVYRLRDTPHNGSLDRFYVTVATLNDSEFI